MSSGEQSKENFGADEALNISKALLPLLLALLLVLAYSIAECLRRGLGPEFYPYTYVPLVGSILSTLGAFSYAFVALPAARAPSRSWLRFTATQAGLIPYFFGLYVFAFLGIYRVWTGFSSSGSSSIKAGVFLTLVGYWILRRIWLLSEMGKDRLSGGSNLK